MQEWSEEIENAIKIWDSSKDEAWVAVVNINLTSPKYHTLVVLRYIQEQTDNQLDHPDEQAEGKWQCNVSANIREWRVLRCLESTPSTALQGWLLCSTELGLISSRRAIPSKFTHKGNPFMKRKHFRKYF